MKTSTVLSSTATFISADIDYFYHPTNKYAARTSADFSLVANQSNANLGWYIEFSNNERESEDENPPSLDLR